MTRRILILAALTYGMATTTSMAQKVSEAQALLRAKTFIGSRASAPADGKQYAQRTTTTTLQKVSDSDAYYVFNIGEDGGFVIVSGDERIGTILGYSTESRFDEKAMPANMRFWLNGIEKTVEAMATSADRYAEEQALASRRASKAAITPLIKTKWFQGWPYNLLVPVKDGQRCLTGCVATSMATLMNYWKYPAATAKTIPAWSGLAAVPAGTEIDWSNMSDYYGSNEWSGLFIDSEDTYYNEVWPETTEQQQQAVAELMKMCGMAVNMDYGVNESWAQATSPLTALKDYFGYKNEMKYLLQDNYTIDNWEQLIYNELQQRRPVLYGGVADDLGFTGGHSFMVDGYDGNGFYHIHWGLETLGNGYFSLAAQRFNQQTHAIVGIQPTVGGTIANVPTVGDYTTDAKVLELTGVTTDGPVWAIETLPGCGNVILTLSNSSSQLFKGLVTVSATDAADMTAFEVVLAEVPAKGSAKVVMPYYQFQFDYGANKIRVSDFSTGEYISGEYTINVERQRIPNLNIEYTLDGVNDLGLITFSTPCTMHYKITSQWAGDPSLKARLCMNLPSGEELVCELGHISFGKAVEGSVKIDAPDWNPLPDFADFHISPRVEFYSDTRTHEFLDYHYQGGTQDGDSRQIVFCKQKPRFATTPQKVSIEKLDGLNEDINMRPAGYYVLGHNGFAGFSGMSMREESPDYYNGMLETAWRDYQDCVSYYTGILRCGSSQTKNCGVFDCPSDKPYTAGSITRTLNGTTVYFPYNVAGVKEAAQRGLYKNEVGEFLPYDGWLELTYTGGLALADHFFEECYLYYYPLVGVEDAIIGISDDARQQNDDKVYDLMGRHLTQPTKPGIYVRGGRKVVIR